MNKKNDIDIGISGIVWMTAMTFGSYIIRLILTYFLARLLTPADYGEMAALNILYGFAELFWMMGVGPAIVQKKELSNSDITTGNIINILLGLFIFAILNIFTKFFCNLFSISDPLMLRVYSIIFVLHSISGVSKSLTQKKCKYNYISIIKLIGIILFGITAIILALLNLKVWSLIVATIIETAFITVVYEVIEPVKLDVRISKESAVGLLYFGGGYTIARIFSYIANEGDNFVVNKTLGKVLLGSYSKAYQLLMYPVTLIGESIDQVLFPLLSKSQEEKGKLRRVFIAGTGLIMLASMPITIVAFICAEPLVSFVLGEQWGMTILPFKIMVTGLFFRIGYKLSDSFIRALGKVYQRAYIQAVYAIFVVFGAFIGHYKGLVGVAFGVMFAFTLNYILMTALSAHFMELKIFSLIPAFIGPLLYGGTAVLGVIILKPYLFAIRNNFLICLFTTLVCFSIYGTAFIFTRRKILNKEQNLMINQIISSIRSNVKLRLKKRKYFNKKNKLK